MAHVEPHTTHHLRPASVDALTDSQSGPAHLDVQTAQTSSTLAVDAQPSDPQCTTRDYPTHSPPQHTSPITTIPSAGAPSQSASQPSEFPHLVMSAPTIIHAPVPQRPYAAHRLVMESTYDSAPGLSTTIINASPSYRATDLPPGYLVVQPVSTNPSRVGSSFSRDPASQHATGDDPDYGACSASPAFPDRSLEKGTNGYSSAPCSKRAYQAYGDWKGHAPRFVPPDNSWTSTIADLAGAGLVAYTCRDRPILSAALTGAGRIATTVWNIAASVPTSAYPITEKPKETTLGSQLGHFASRLKSCVWNLREERTADTLRNLAGPMAIGATTLALSRVGVSACDPVSWAAATIAGAAAIWCSTVNASRAHPPAT